MSGEVAEAEVGKHMAKELSAEELEKRSKPDKDGNIPKEIPFSFRPGWDRRIRLARYAEAVDKSQNVVLRGILEEALPRRERELNRRNEQVSTETARADVTGLEAAGAPVVVPIKTEVSVNGEARASGIPLIVEVDTGVVGAMAGAECLDLITQNGPTSAPHDMLVRDVVGRLLEFAPDSPRRSSVHASVRELFLDSGPLVYSGRRERLECSFPWRLFSRFPWSNDVVVARSVEVETVARDLVSRALLFYEAQLATYGDSLTRMAAEERVFLVELEGLLEASDLRGPT